MSDQFQTIKLEQVDRVAVVALNRPAALNAINDRMIEELETVLNQVDRDQNVRVVILTAVERGFCAGADIKESAARSLVQQIAFLRRLNDIIIKLENLAKPVIAAIDGWALGGGFELILGTDLAFATQTSTFGAPEINRGGLAAAGGTQRLPRAIGRAKAKELLFTGRTLTASEAEALGLLIAVVPDKQALTETTMQLAASLAEKAPLALAQNKRLVNLGTDMPLGLALEMAHEAATVVMGSADKREGSTAFAEKRKPRYKGE